jgi:hypothetical protein
MMDNRYKGREVPKVIPWPIIDNNVVNVVYGIASGNNEAVVYACDNLGFPSDDFLKFQRRSSLVVEFINGKIGNISNV